MNAFTAFSGFALVLLCVSCRPKAELTDRPNTVDITTHSVKKADGDWTEIVIKQTLSFKSPMVVGDIRTELADTMQFGVQSYSDQHDKQGRHIGRTMIIHARPLKPNQKIVLTQKDFVFNPSIISWKPITIQ